MTNCIEVDELNRLLEDGFRISEINYDFNDKKFSSTATLEKSEDKKIVTSANPYFFEYLQHFKRVLDNYNNPHFVYVDENTSNGNTTNINEFKTKSSDYYIKIGDRLLNKNLIIQMIEQPGPKRPSAHAVFYINHATNPEFKDIDARDPLEIYRKSDGQLVYKGVINGINHLNDESFFECETAPRSLTTTKVSAEFTNFNSLSALYFVANCAALKLDPRIPVNLSEKDFIIIVPILDFIIQDSFSFGGIEFYSLFDSKDDYLIKKSQFCQKEADWASSYVRARLRLKSISHYDAIQLGYEKITSVVDWLIFCNDLSMPVIEDDSGKIFARYDYFKHYSRISTSTMVYCREINRESTCVFDTRELVGNKLVIDSNLKEYFKPTKEIFEKILAKTRENSSQMERNILLSLHWLARTVREGTNLDRLLDLWTSLELIVLRDDSIYPFSDMDKLKILEKVMDLDFSKQQLDILENKLAMVNDVPLMEHLRRTVDKLSLSFSTSEWALLRSTRQKRNSIEHGMKECQVSREEIEKLRSLTERIIIAVAKEAIK